MNVTEEVKTLLGRVLGIEHRARHFEASTALFGAIAELDSRAVITLIAALEEKFDIVVADDEITAEVFETLGSLTKFIERKLAA